MRTTNGPSLETVDEYLNVLAYEQCRAVLSYFVRRSTEVTTLDDLADFIHDPLQQGKDERQTRIRLHHVTLPRLADVGVLEYDVQSKTVRYRGQPTVERWVTQLVEQEGCVVSTYDTDGEGTAEAAEETEQSTGELTETEPREQATQYLQTALSVTESANKKFHIRQALQLLTINER